VISQWLARGPKLALGNWIETARALHPRREIANRNPSSKDRPHAPGLDRRLS